MVIDPTGAYCRPEGESFIAGMAPSAYRDPPSVDFDVQHELFDNLCGHS